jgi:hypothetical protein
VGESLNHFDVFLLFYALFLLHLLAFVIFNIFNCVALRSVHVYSVACYR